MGASSSRPVVNDTPGRASPSNTNADSNTPLLAAEDQQAITDPQAAPAASQTNNDAGQRFLALNYGCYLRMSRFAGVSGAFKLAKATSTTHDALIDYTHEASTTAIMQAVVNGNEAAAQLLLESYPDSLLRNANPVKDHSGRLIRCFTPFQAAMAAGDVEMAQMMKQFFYTLQENSAEYFKDEYVGKFDANDEITLQFNEVFPGPEGSSAKERLELLEKKQKDDAQEFAESELKAIFEAIISASSDDVTKALNKDLDAATDLNQALKRFREVMQAQSKGERVFNPHRLLQVFKAYDDNYDRLYAAGGSDWVRCDLAWRQVVGYVQRYLPACYAQAFARGLYDIVDKGEAAGRSFDFSFGGGAIYPLSFNSELGFDWGAACGVLPGCSGGGVRPAGWRAALESLCRTKTAGFCRLSHSPNQRQSLRAGA